LRKQLLEREAFVSSLEKSLSTESEVEALSPPILKSRVNSESLSASSTCPIISLGSASIPEDKVSMKIGTGKKTRIAAAFDSPSNQKGMNIDSLRKMTDFQRKAKKTLAQLR
jgi:hypothetical protein